MFEDKVVYEENGRQYAYGLYGPEESLADYFGTDHIGEETIKEISNRLIDKKNYIYDYQANRWLYWITDDYDAQTEFAETIQEVVEEMQIN